MNRVKDSLHNFLGTAKAAGQLAAAQSKKTKLNTIDLPASYFALGKQVLESGRYNDQFPSEHEQIKKLDEQIAKNNERTEAEGSDFKQKMKAGADNVKKAGLLKTTQVKRDSVLKTLGKTAFAAQLNDPEFAGACKTIAEVNGKVELIDAEINRLSEIDKGKVVTPKRVLIGAGVLAVLWLIGVVAGPPTERSTGSTNSRSDQKMSDEKRETLTPDFVVVAPNTTVLFDEVQYGFESSNTDISQRSKWTSDSNGAIRFYPNVDDPKLKEYWNNEIEFRQKSGFVEVRDSLKSKKGTWVRFLKLDAEMGDKWNSAFGEFELVKFNDGQAVIELVANKNAEMLFGFFRPLWASSACSRVRYVLQKDIGVVRIDAYLSSGGVDSEYVAFSRIRK